MSRIRSIFSVSDFLIFQEICLLPFQKLNLTVNFDQNLLRHLCNISRLGKIINPKCDFGVFSFVYIKP